MTKWNAAPMPELGLELVRDVDRERFRSRLPRWDPRLWGDAQFSKNTRPGNRLLKLGLAWGRERVKARKLQQENVTPRSDVAPVSRFTGKEEDVEVGLTYFGKRYLSPYLGRWVSADPLEIHSPGQADLNLYAYVHGQTLRNTDPHGLAGGRAWTENEQFAYEAGKSNAQVDHVYNQLAADAKRELIVEQADPASYDRFMRGLNSWRAASYFQRPTDKTLQERMDSGYNSVHVKLEAGVALAFALKALEVFDGESYMDPSGGCKDKGINCAGMTDGVKLAARAARRLGVALSKDVAKQMAEQIGKRMAYMGASVRVFGAGGRVSAVGQRLVQRLVDKGKLEVLEDGVLTKASRVKYLGKELTLGQFEAGHKKAAVHWWNEKGKTFGARSREVREWMMDESNYELQLVKSNRAEGPSLPDYDDPLH